MKKIFVFFASAREANPFLFQSKYRFRKEDPQLFEVSIKSTLITIVITGIGQENVYKATGGLRIEQDSCIIKAGTCAVPGRQKELLKPYLPSFVSDGLKFYPACDKLEENWYCKDDGLISLPGPLNSERHFKSPVPGKTISFADMESFYLFSRYETVKSKYVLLAGTDRGKGDVKKEFLTHIKKASYILKDALVHLLDKKLIE